LGVCYPTRHTDWNIIASFGVLANVPTLVASKKTNVT
jgi:hypothetical protein